MKLLIKTGLTLALLFATTFILIKVMGVLTVEDIKYGFAQIKDSPSYVIGSLVVLLLFADLFIAIPTMTVIVLSGFFLGFGAGFFYSFVGVALAAICGYLFSRRWGDSVLRKIEPDAKSRHEAYSLFQQHGMLVLILARAMPILPEVSACLAGICKMPLSRFVLGWGLGTIPYLLVVSYAGSISDMENPTPAIIAAIAVTTTLWLAWMGFVRYRMQAQ